MINLKRLFLFLCVASGLPTVHAMDSSSSSSSTYSDDSEFDNSKSDASEKAAVKQAIKYHQAQQATSVRFKNSFDYPTFSNSFPKRELRSSRNPNSRRSYNRDYRNSPPILRNLTYPPYNGSHSRRPRSKTQHSLFSTLSPQDYHITHSNFVNGSKPKSPSSYRFSNIISQYKNSLLATCCICCIVYITWKYFRFYPVRRREKRNPAYSLHSKKNIHYERWA